MQHKCLINEETGDDKNDGIQDPVKTEARAKEILNATGDHIAVKYKDGDNDIIRIRRDVTKTLTPLLEELCYGDPGKLLLIKSVIGEIDNEVREHETHVHNHSYSMGGAAARLLLRSGLGINSDGTFR